MRPIRSFFLLVLILPSALAGQSVLGASGLGARLEPLDAIERALGGMGVTTRTATVLPGNPVASLDLLAPTVTFTAQPHWGNFEVGSESGDFFATRFPVLGFAYPLGTDAVVTLTAGSQFDQNWSVESRDSIDIGGGSVGLTDTFLSDGAVSVVQAGWARRWSDSFAFGATIGVYRGGLQRSFVREFDEMMADSVALENPIESFGSNGRWNHGGPLATLNMAWDPSAALQVGATLAWGGTLKVNPAEGATSVGREVSVPLELKVSTSAVLTSSLTVNAGGSYSNWTDVVDSGVQDVGAGKVMSYGAGMEWETLSFWAGSLPLRLGFRRSVLPFRFLGRKVRENTISFGFSIVMSQEADFTLGTMDVAFETGNRKSGTYEESLRRLTVTLRVGGL